MIHPVTQYAIDVVHGDIKKHCCKWEVLACKRHLNDLERQGTEQFPYVFDETRADRILRFFSALTRQDKPDENIQLENWQIFDQGCVFGWVHKDTGARRFNTAYNRIARGHAKTTVAAGDGLYFMTSDALYPPGRPELAVYEMQPEVVICAVDAGQGARPREDMYNIGITSPAVKKRLTLKQTYIKHATRGGKVIVLSKDTKNKDGGRPSLIITEEWHAHESSKIHDTAVSGMGKRAQCLELIITTAGTDAENKPCYRDDLFYKRILSGEVERENIFIMIRELDDGDDPHDESAWAKSNPFFRNSSEYGRQLYETVKEQHDTAYSQGDADKIREWLIKRANRWQADSENKYMSGCMDKLKALKATREEFARLIKGGRGHGGFDLGKTLDLSGTAYVASLEDGRIAVKVHGFMPQNRATEHEHGDRVPYKDWAADGYVTLTPGSVTDNRYAEQWFYDFAENYEITIDEIDYDGHNATDMAIRMAERMGEDKIVEIPQTCAGLNLATKRFRELVLQGKLVYEESPLFEWCLSNAIEVKNNFGDIKLSKKHKDDSQRIDPAAAMMNALARLIVKIDEDPNKLNNHVLSDGWSL